MPGIYLMATLVILVTSILAITTLNHLSPSNQRFYWLMALTLPASFLVNKLVKIPLITGVGALAGIPLKLGAETPLWFIVLIWLAAPITEEAIKILHLVLPQFRASSQNAAHALSAGLALGFGFGLGEAAYLAYGVAQSPDYSQLPWYMFIGFAMERLVVTFGHGFMTSAATLGLFLGGRKAPLGYLTAVGLHALINFSAILMALKLMPVTLASAGSYAMILVAFVIFQRNLRAVRKTDQTVPVEVDYFERR